MRRYAAFLRGINVGRAKRVAMGDLRALLQALGCSDVQTVLNSGNAVFAAPATAPLRLARRIRAAVAAELGVDAAVVVKSAADMAAILAGNRLAERMTDPSKLLVALAADAASLAALASLPASSCDDVHLGSHAAYVWCPNGILESQMAAALLKGLGPLATTRNWATVEKVNALLRQAAA